MSSGALPNTSSGNIVKEGWLYKRGEHIRTWRARYFVLRDTGSLFGYRVMPDYNSASAPIEPINNFTVQNCQIMPVDRPRPFTFLIRGLQLTTVIERTFHADSEEERQEWLDAIRLVSGQLKGRALPSTSEAATVDDIDMPYASQDSLSSAFAVQGTSTGRISGKKKVVSII